MRTPTRYIQSTILLILIPIILSGCGGVSRQLTIKTDPPEALVFLNDEEIGLSPVTVSFNWYGDYSVRVSKLGYETLNTHRLLKPPWYDGFPFDFIASFCWPERTVDEYEWDFKLEPYQPPEKNELIGAARKFQAQALAEFQKPAMPK